MSARPERVVRMAYLVASVCGIAFFAMSVLLLGVLPARMLQRQTTTMSPEHPLGLSASETRGRAIYSREGCAYCHTQQIRYVEADMNRFGAPTLAWETRYDYPHLWGTRRIGPDLAREGATHSEDWHYAHLYSPRTLVPDSVMPNYPWLYDGSPDRPTQDARDLVAYLESLGRAREIAGPEGEARAMAACKCDGDEMAMMAFHAKRLNASPARTQRTGKAPATITGFDPLAGRKVYQANCAGCHGSEGSVAAEGLHPAPADLTAHKYTTQRLADVLWNGSLGTAMPGWRDLSAADRASLALAVQSLYRPQPEPSIPAATLDLGKRVYADNCAQCHGKDGAGDGTAVGELRIAPANFQQVQPSIAASLAALRNGVDGTQMAPWTSRLSEAELSAVAYYVRGFYR